MKLSYSQECKLSFAQLSSLANYSLSEFDNFALKNGFSLNTHDQTYFCDSEAHNGHHNLLSRQDTATFLLIIYSFYDKKDYLIFKEILEKGEFIGEQNEKGILRFKYSYTGKIIILQVGTAPDNSNTYMISLAAINNQRQP